MRSLRCLHCDAVREVLLVRSEVFTDWYRCKSGHEFSVEREVALPDPQGRAVPRARREPLKRRRTTPRRRPIKARSRRGVRLSSRRERK